MKDENINLLNDYMCNLKVMINNLYNMHFNIVGPSFFSIHKKLKEYYEKVSDMYDSIAERIKMLGGLPITSLNKIEETSTIKSMCSMNFTGVQVMEVLENDFDFLNKFTKDLISYYEKEKDYYTSDILHGNLNFLEKELWMVKTSLI